MQLPLHLFHNNSTLDDSLFPKTCILLPIFSIPRIRRVLSNLDVSKAYDLFGILPRAISECASELLSIINKLFRLNLKKKIFLHPGNIS